MNDKYLKIYRFPKGTAFNQTVLENKFEEKILDNAGEEGFDPFEKVIHEG